MLEIAIPSERRVVNCEDIDINVYLDADTGRVHLSAYPAFIDADGSMNTDIFTGLFSAETNLDPEDYTTDGEWYGWVDAMPGQIPGDVVRIVSNILKEVLI